MGKPVIWGPGFSAYVRTVRLTCEEKGAAYELHDVDLLGGVHREPEHLARHPFGKVPGFEHDGFSLYETTAICRYLDLVLPGISLTPAEPKAIARMQQVIGVVDSYAYPSFVGGVVVERILAPLRGATPDEAKIAAALPQVERCLDAFATIMGENRFMAGPEISLADLHLAPIMGHLAKTPEGPPRLAARPALAGWWERMSARESMRRTEPKLG